MDWEHKAEALNALAQISIHMRQTGDWYIGQSVEVGGDGMLTGEYGNGTDPCAAIENHWQKLVVDLPPNKYLVTRPIGDERKQVRWNGYMWQDVP